MEFRKGGKYWTKFMRPNHFFKNIFISDKFIQRNKKKTSRHSLAHRDIDFSHRKHSPNLSALCEKSMFLCAKELAVIFFTFQSIKTVN